jgi:hypothetical protein
MLRRTKVRGLLSIRNANSIVSRSGWTDSCQLFRIASRLRSQSTSELTIYLLQHHLPPSPSIPTASTKPEPDSHGVASRFSPTLPCPESSARIGRSGLSQRHEKGVGNQASRLSSKDTSSPAVFEQCLKLPQGMKDLRDGCRSQEIDRMEAGEVCSRLIPNSSFLLRNFVCAFQVNFAPRQWLVESH